jgi:hypothetical protein
VGAQPCSPGPWTDEGFRDHQADAGWADPENAWRCRRAEINQLVKPDKPTNNPPYWYD